MSNSHLTVPAELGSLKAILDFAAQAGTQSGLPKESMYHLRLAVEELAVNIIQHGYKGKGGEIKIQIQRDPTNLAITLIDSAPPFDPAQQAKPDHLDDSADVRPLGGVGIYLALENADEYHYEYADGHNYTTVIFSRPTATLNRNLISSKTARMNQVTGSFTTGMARLVSSAVQLKSDLQKLIKYIQQHNLPLPFDPTPSFQKLEESMKKAQENSHKVFDQLDQFQKMIDTSIMIYSSLELDQVLANVMDTVISLTRAERASLIFYEDGVLNLQVARDVAGQTLTQVPYDENIILEAIENNRPLIVTPATHQMTLQSGSVLCIPLMVHGKLIGILYAEHQGKANAFDDDLIPVLSLFANQSAVAIQNARMYERSRHETRLERDLQIAQEIQTGFLPSELPDVTGWEIAPYFYPARHVSGDFYDVFSLANDRLGFVVGDVCDKGLGSALFMALFRSLLRAFAQQPRSVAWMDDLAEIPTRKLTLEERRTKYSGGAVSMKNAIQLTNDYIAINHGDANMFATLFFGVIDPEKGLVTYINAGHNPPLLFDKHGQMKAKLSRTGPAVGMMPQMDFQLAQIELETGDFLTCFTDGLVEARNHRKEQFSEDRLIRLLSTEPDQSAQGLVNRLRSAVEVHIGETDQFDDITLLVIHRQ